MILFYAAGASSQAAHILLRESGLPFKIEPVNLTTHTWSGGNYNDLNSKHYVPLLLLDNGDVLTECQVILQFIADQVPEKKLIPPAYTPERYHAMEWLNFIATEIHKNFISPERDAGIAANFLSKTASGQAQTRIHVSPRLAWIDRQLENKEYLSGNAFTAPDAYLFTMLTWANRLSIDLANWANLKSYFERIGNMSSVKKTLEIEGPPHSLLEEKK